MLRSIFVVLFVSVRYGESNAALNNQGEAGETHGSRRLLTYRKIIQVTKEKPGDDDGEDGGWNRHVVPSPI